MTKSNFTKKKIANKIYQKLGFSKSFSSIFIDDFFDVIRSDLIKLNKVKISSFGTLEILNKKERVGRNPKTKILAKITSRKVVKFKPATIIKRKINNL